MERLIGIVEISSCLSESRVLGEWLDNKVVENLIDGEHDIMNVLATINGRDILEMDSAFGNDRCVGFSNCYRQYICRLSEQTYPEPDSVAHF